MIIGDKSSVSSSFEKSIDEVIVPTSSGFSLLPAASGTQELTELDDSQKRFLLNELDDLNEEFDIILIDTGAGISSNVMYFNFAAMERLVVLTNEPTSLTDAYAVIKILTTKYNQKKFDSGKGVGFKSYAEFRIKGAMIDELRAMDWVPRSVRKNAKTLTEAYSRVENKKMRPAEDEEVAKELGLDMDGFYRLLDTSRGISIFNEYDMMNNISSSEGNSDDNVYETGFELSPLQSLKKSEIVSVIAGAIDRLPKNERTAVSLYYYEELTMREIGQVMGYTESRVSQLHTKAVLRLRNTLKGYFDK